MRVWRIKAALLALLGAVILSACSVETEPATVVSTTSAKLHATMSWDYGETGKSWFEYAEQGQGGSDSWTRDVGLQWGHPSGGPAGPFDLSRTITGLDLDTTYEYRVCGYRIDPSPSGSDTRPICWDQRGDAHEYGQSGDWDTFTTAAPPSWECDYNVTTSTFAGVFASASGGDVLCLASGDYGTFDGAVKSGEVTLTPDGDADVKMALDFDPAANITIDGLTINDAYISNSRTHDITVRNSDFPGQAHFNTAALANAGILFERNVHHDYDPCGQCGEGRIWLPGDSSQPTGITIRDSEFYGGVSDGIQNGSNGTKIIGNSFHDLDYNGVVHSDAIQLYGSSNTTIRSNLFYNLIDVPAIMIADGADHEIIEDNVIRGDDGAYPYSITLLSDNGSIIRHNTFADGDCTFDISCGVVRLGAKSGDPAGTGTVVKDNVLSAITLDGSGTYSHSYNLLAHQSATGTGEIAGSPTYVGPLSDYVGFRLTAGSNGKGVASDGLDMGIR